MRPSFISKTQAATILATGKSVAFLQELCKKTAEPLKWQGLDAALNSTSRANANTLWAMDGELQACIEAAHKEVSRRALSVMLDEGKLSVHLMALRRYLLLGQGDFVKQLMENIAAIRATNAQYDDPDVLARLDVKLMQMSSGEVGWDSFTLKYNVEGPIAMIFTNEVTTKYLCLFNALWRAKRAEWVLSNLWKRQTTSARILQKIAAERLRRKEFRSQLCAITQCLRNIAASHKKLEALLSEKCHKELERRNKQQREAEQLERENKFGASDEMDAAERLRRKEFRSQLCAITQCLRNIAASHKEMVHKFLVSLASQTNEDLQLLSYRLDFNEHYTESYKNLNEAEVM
ncbi:hypothetical protein B566_EDAN012065 [Ephemera danica]|nr:hypothetical protein B566_EDAN012065 [Ephemera danica]